MNAGCRGASGTIRSHFYAAAPVGAPTPTCMWTCSTNANTPCTVAITGADGLPVELLDFYIDETAVDPQDRPKPMTQDGTTDGANVSKP